MPTETHILKCGKKLVAPALFIHIQTKRECQIVKDAVERYPIDKKNEGLNNIDGMIASLKDWEEIAPFLTKKNLGEFDENHYSLSARIRLMDPSLYFPFMGEKPDKESFCEVTRWIPEL